MDLSQFSTEDLQAMKAGDISKMSTEGLGLLKQAHASVTPQAPATAPAPTEPEPGALEAFLRGGVQGATLGFGDELAGGGGALIDKFTGNGGDKSLGDLYQQNLDSARAANAAAQKAHPYLYGGGNLAGGLASGALTGGLGAETALGRIGANAALGAGAGVGFGNAEDLGGAAQDAVKGGLVGGAVGGLVEGAKGLLNPENLEKFANTRSAAALGADKAAIKRLGAENVQKIGRGALDEGIVSPLAGTQTMTQRAEALATKGGKGMQDVYDAIDNAGASTFSPTKVADSVDSQLGDFYRSPINRDLSTQLDNTLDSIKMRGAEGREAAGGALDAANGKLQSALEANSPEASINAAGDVENAQAGAADADTVPMTEAQKLKEEIGRVAYPPGRKINPDTITDKQLMAQQAYGIVSKAIDDAAAEGADAVGEADLAGALKLAKGQYGTAKGALGLLANREAKEQGNKVVGLTDSIVGGAGYLAAGPKGLAAVAGKKVLERYGNQTAAVAADRLADVVRSAPEVLGPWAKTLADAAERGSIALGATNAVLMQTSPEYRAHMKTVFGGDK